MSLTTSILMGLFLGSCLGATFDKRHTDAALFAIAAAIALVAWVIARVKMNETKAAE